MPEALILEFTGVSNADYESVNQQLGMAVAAVVFWRARRRKLAAPAVTRPAGPGPGNAAPGARHRAPR